MESRGQGKGMSPDFVGSYTWIGIFYGRVVRVEMQPRGLDHLGFQL
jgi:hypothetical protein